MMFFILSTMLLPARAQETVFRGGVALVKVDAEVTDRAGRVISGLTAADFEVTDDGSPQKIAWFGHDAEPLDLVLLLDVSGSMHRWLAELAGTAHGALGGLHAGDRVAVMLFAREAAVRQDLTANLSEVQSEIRDAVQDRSFGSGTAINAAIVKAARYVAGQPPNRRRAVLIVTDNLSLNYKVTDADVVRALYDADTVLNAILIGRQKRPDPVKPGQYTNPDFTPSDVFRLAEETGGEAMESRQVAKSFEQMIERIRARYTMQYPAPPTSPGALHRIGVRLTPEAARRYPQAVIRARTGYYAPR
jgi:Ca-activated chloride channel family protein